MYHRVVCRHGGLASWSRWWHGPSCEHYLLGGLAIRFVRGMGGFILGVWAPQIYVVVIGVYIGR